jgi:HSP20 family molecular chaperone IbpA
MAKVTIGGLADHFNQKFDYIDRCVKDQWKDWQPELSSLLPTLKDHHVEKVEGGWRLLFLLPGFDKKELSVEAKGSYIEVTAKKENNENYNNLIMASTYKNILIGDMDTENVSAELKNGILWIDIPAKEKKSSIVIK